MERKEWFAEWFDSKYYHILYKNRNYHEAETFLSKLIDFLKPELSDKIIDLACGKGRHSIYLNKLGYNVTGVDLSANSIKEASSFANENLKFEIADLRDLPYNNIFDIGLNLFTSFGYFESDEVNMEVFSQFNKILKPNGIILVDFFNATKIYAQTNCVEAKEIEGIDFQIHKKIEDKRVIKTIEFSDNGKKNFYSESVQLLELIDFEKLVDNSSFKLLHVFGNYNLEPFNQESSDRLIIVAQKIA
jgi:SAM-dependent methyltransferase